MLYLLSILGLMLSVYMIYVFQKLKTTEGKYASVCDINEKISCTKVSKTTHAKTFGIPNGVWGIFFYTALLIVSFLQWILLLQVLVIAGILVSLYLAYKLYEIKILCPVCASIHLINFLLFWNVLFF